MSAVALTSSDSAQLSRCEAVIESGLRTFVEVGEALMEIRDSRLYRETHGTFEDYCQERWGMTHANAGRAIRSAEVAATLASPNGLTESQARELAPLRDRPEVLREAWQEANHRAETAGRKVTAEVVREVVTDFKPGTKPKRKEQPAPDRPMQYLNEMLDKDSPRNLRTQIVRWCELGHHIEHLLDNRAKLEPKDETDLALIGAEVRAMAELAKRLSRSVK